MSDPITAAFAVTPDWMLDIRAYDGLEIQPCHTVGFADDGKEIVGPGAEPEAAEFMARQHRAQLPRLAMSTRLTTIPDPADRARACAGRLRAACPHLRDQRSSRHVGLS